MNTSDVGGSCGYWHASPPLPTTRGTTTRLSGGAQWLAFDEGYALGHTIINMSKATRSSKSFTIDRSILDYLQRTRSSHSRSERVNELLRRAILEEQYEALEKEAAEFFAAVGKSERAESKAFAAAQPRFPF